MSSSPSPLRDRNDAAQRTGAAVGDHLAEIARLFVPGTKLTFIARQPDAPDGSRNMVITDDEPVDAIRALAQSIRRPAEPV